MAIPVFRNAKIMPRTMLAILIKMRHLRIAKNAALVFSFFQE